MPALESHTGLLKQTIPFYNKRKFVDLSNKLPYYSAAAALMRNAKKSITTKHNVFNFGLPTEVRSEGGYQFEWNVQVSSHNTLEWVSDDDPVNIDRRDFQVRANLPWRLCRVQKWSYTTWELQACKGEQELVSLTTSRALGNEQGACDGLENWFWAAPPASTDTKTAFPLRYYLYTEPESSAGSYSSSFNAIGTGELANFMNLNHNSYSGGPASISRVTYPRAGNWNCQYTTFNDTDLIEKVTHACLSTGFHSPTESPRMVPENLDKALYTTKANMIIKARLARQQNDQNGNDLNARFTESDMFKLPMYWVPAFDDTNRFTLYSGANKDVVYGIAWDSWYWASRTGFTMEDEIFPPSLEAPKTYTHVRFLGGQLVCMDPAQNFVLSK